jgi:hypothetical protein
VIAAAVLIVNALLSATCAEPLFYATGENGSWLVRIDLGTGEVRRIGRFGASGCMALAFGPDGKAYTVTDSMMGMTPRLASVDLSSGKATIIGSEIPALMALVFSPEGRLYGVNTFFMGGSGTLFNVDFTTGEAFTAGEEGGVGDIMGLAYHPDGTLYGLDHQGTLWRVDLTTGTSTRVKEIEGITWPMGLAIDLNGTVYASEYSTFARIHRIDLDSGRATELLETPINFLHSLALPPAPRLRISHQGKELLLSWPASAVGFGLQAATGLEATPREWADLSLSPETTDDQNVVLLAKDGPSRFFRLIKR